jgi:hypothetical protein
MLLMSMGLRRLGIHINHAVRMPSLDELRELEIQLNSHTREEEKKRVSTLIELI